MSKAWIRGKLPVFVRDVVRDLCLSAQVLEEQFGRFDRYGQVDFAVLRDLLGEEANKGLLYRLKDTAHHLFRSDGDPRLVGHFLDWGIGYVFHETMKLKEDAYQQQNYGPWFRSLQSTDLPGDEARICSDLYQVILQTRESVSREVARVRFILDHLRKLTPIYLAAHAKNALLARLLYDQDDLVRGFFGPEYQTLVGAVYGDAPEDMYLLAAQSLRQGGWMDDAAAAVETALRLAPANSAVKMEKEIVDTWKKRLRV